MGFCNIIVIKRKGEIKWKEILAPISPLSNIECSQAVTITRSHSYPFHRISRFNSAIAQLFYDPFDNFQSTTMMLIVPCKIRRVEPMPNRATVLSTTNDMRLRGSASTRDESKLANNNIPQ